MKRIFLTVLFAVLGVIIAGSVFSLIGSYVLDLAVKKESRSEQAGKVGFQGSVRLSDGNGRVVYATEGDVQCGG